MGGGNFGALPSTPPATTVWFGAIIDRLNMLVQGTSQGNPTAVVPAQFGNLWAPAAASFGSFTTAPDGTTNVAQQIVEDTSTGTHIVTATTNIRGAFGSSGWLRFSGFFKAAGRRVGMQVKTSIGGNPDSGVQIVFDLVGGQIGVPAGLLGSNGTVYTILGSEIVAFPNGWYRCSVDFVVTTVSFTNSTNILATIFLDNGTGTGALSNSYTGNGSSGAFCWRTNLMPVGAYRLNNVSFLDDFTTLATIDTGNTLAPGFNWYLNDGFTGYLTAGQATFALAGSILTITGGTNQGVSHTQILGLAQLNAFAGTTVGSNAVITMPFLIEGSFAFDTTLGWLNGEVTPFWVFDKTLAINFGFAQTGSPQFNPLGQRQEFDFFEIGFNVNFPVVNGGFGWAPQAGAIEQTATISADNNAVPGIPSYQVNSTYGPGTNVAQGGLIYQSNTTVPPNNTPPGADWNTYTPYGGLPSNPALLSDFGNSVFHTYSHLLLPYAGSGKTGTAGPDAIGIWMAFFDGLLTSIATVWSPAGGVNIETFLQSTESHPMVIAIGAQTNSPAGPPTRVDYIKVTQ